jgi:hypothetical protein
MSVVLMAFIRFFLIPVIRTDLTFIVNVGQMEITGR